MFCGKDLWKMFLSRQQKSPKKLVSRQWKEGKKSMSRIITLYSHCAQYAMSNSHCHLQLGARGAVSPPVGSGQGLGGGPGGEAKILCLLFQEGNYASLIYQVKLASSLWKVAKIN